MRVSQAEIEYVKNNSTCLLDVKDVENMLSRLAAQITQQCSEKNPVVLCVMTGAVVAVGQLLPLLDFPLEMDCIHATRYQGKTVGEELVWKQRPVTSLANRNVIIIDDVLDEGITMVKLKEYCLEQGASGCYTVVLVDKDLAKEKPIKADFIGFQTGSQYLFGLGMDYKGYLRNVAGLYACPDNLEEALCQL